VANAKNRTESFLRLLSAGVLERSIIDGTDLETLQESPTPCNPMDHSAIEHSPELRFAFKRAFDQLLNSPRSLDWDAIRASAASLTEQVKTLKENRERARQDTRWLLLDRRNRFFDIERWESAWSRRNLELVLGFFTPDALYRDAALGYVANGKPDLRRLLIRLLHSSVWTFNLNSWRYCLDADCSKIQVTWERPYPSVDRTNDFSQALPQRRAKGTTELTVQLGKVLHCQDAWSPADLMPQSMETAGPDGTIRLLKVLKLRRRLERKGSSEEKD
jgi:hypothetical protein